MTNPLTETSIDLDAYFQRIGYEGERTPTLPTLRAIHALHATAIPFEMMPRSRRTRIAGDWRVFSNAVPVNRV